MSGALERKLPGIIHAVHHRDPMERLHLPACQRCRSRKTRCDNKGPKCSSCTRSHASCIIVDPITGENYSRTYIHDLENKERSLLDRLQNTESPSNVDFEGALPNASDSGRKRRKSASASQNFIGEGSGLSFLRSMLLNAHWNLTHVDILQQLAQRHSLEGTHAAINDFPPLGEASMILSNYFRRFHTQHSFLLTQQASEVFDKVYGQSAEQPAPQDRYRLFMIFAIGSITLYRQGLTQYHPLGYYAAAQSLLKVVPLLGSVDAIQNLLLIARVGIYYPTGTSLWFISRVCMQQCVELGLHTRPQRVLDPLIEQKHKRIFWDCYVLDRYSSIILGRPFAIADADVSVDLPIALSDEHVKSPEIAALSNTETTNLEVTSGIAPFLCYTRLQKICSRIHAAFYTRSERSENANPHDHRSSAGDTSVLLYQFLSELESWRRTAPSFVSPDTLYETSEFYDFLLEKEKLFLIRGAIHRAPKHRGVPSSELLQLCRESATNVIDVYSGLFNSGFITWTRGYFQVLFTAGLTVMYCLALVEDTTTEKHLGSHGALKSCGELLARFGNEMPDAKKFADLFLELQNAFQGSRGAISSSSTRAARHSHATSWTIGNQSLQTPRSDSCLASRANPHDLVSDRDAMASRPVHSDQAPAPQVPGAAALGEPDIGFLTMEDGLCDVSQYPLITDEIMQLLEAGLGEYVLGDPYGNAFFLDPSASNPFDIPPGDV